ncbi:MAG TPA: TolC family protein [Gemmatimonadales bacterium]|nr:TolC family protein [Gemmatimonadales bacterium]
MRILPIIGLALLPAALAAQQPAREPIQLTLDDAIRRALAGGNDVQIAEAGVRQAEGQVTQAWSTALPEIRASVTYTRTFASVYSSMGQMPTLAPFSPDTTAPLANRIRYLEQEYPNSVIRGIGGLFSSLPFGRLNTYVAALTVSQTLFQGGKIGAGIAGAHAYERAARAQLDETRRDVTYRVKQAYLNALYTERIVAITEASQVLVNDQLHRVTLNHQVGSSADYDLLRAQVEAANQEPLVIAARNGRDIALLEVRRIVNIPADQPVELVSPLPETTDSLPRVDFAALDLDEAGRAALAAAEANVEFRRQAVRVYHGDYYPTLKLSSSYGGEAFPAGLFPAAIGDFRKDWSASLTLSVPLFDGLRTHGAVLQAQAELQRAEAQLSQTREGVQIEIEQARAEIVRAQALVQARHETVGQAARAQHLATVRYANGIATAIEVSDARLALQQASVNEALATRDYLLAIAALERALGHSVPLVRAQVRVTEGQ